MENIVKINIKEIDEFENHPFQVNNDESLKQLMESIKINGLLNPLIVRKKENGRYELISGHRRKFALELLKETTVDVIIKDLSDEEAIIYMVDSNMYREKILPSEKAFAYKMKMDAIKHQGKTLGTEYPKLRSSEIIGKQSGESEKMIRNYIRLTNLIPELLELVDSTAKQEHKIFLTMGIKPAVELSYLNKDEQTLVYSTITYLDITPSHAQTRKIRDLSNKKLLNFDSLEEIMCEKKGNQNEQIAFNKKKIESELPANLIKRDKRYIEQYIIEAIKFYKKQKDSIKNEINII